MSVKFDVVTGDVRTTPSDALILKYAQGFFGGALAVAHALEMTSSWRGLDAGNHVTIRGNGKIAPKNVLFYGVPNLFEFGYEDIRNFSYASMIALTSSNSECSTVTLTMHGVEYGLDEREAFTAQLAGLMEFVTTSKSSERVQEIIFVELDQNRCQRLKKIMQQVFQETGFDQQRSVPSVSSHLPDAGMRSVSKKARVCCHAL